MLIVLKGLSLVSPKSDVSNKVSLNHSTADEQIDHDGKRLRNSPKFQIFFC